MKRLFFILFLFLFSCSNGSNNHCYRIAIDPQFYPANLQGKEPYVMGFMRELFEKIGEKEKIDICLVELSWDLLVEHLENQRVDAIISMKQPYTFNRDKLEFSTLVLETGPVLVLPTAFDFDQEWEDLNGKEIAVLNDKEATALLQYNPNILVRDYSLASKALSDVVNEVIDGAVLGILIAQSYCTDIYDGVLDVSSSPLIEQGFRLISMKGEQDKLMKRFTHGLEKLKRNSDYTELLEKWSLTD